MNNLEQTGINSSLIASGEDDISLTSFYDIDFSTIVLQVNEAIHKGLLPQRIVQGSSGSYFVKNLSEECIGIFKPKDEEPYGHLNPKWTKWMQKICCPCCFGRGCLLINQGYLSEAGASLVDSKLSLNIVPKTKIVKLGCESFNYSAIDRAKSKTKKNLICKFPQLTHRFNRLELPKKIGSLQLFVNGYKDADYWLRQFELEPLSSKLQYSFQLQFERLVILDYLIRNTDRGNDNWLIQYEKADFVENLEEIDDWNVVNEGFIRIAAIDNGLAFPFKHPDEWRTYPYNWAWLKMAHIPFSNETANEILPKLSDQSFIQSLSNDLFHLFKIDKGFEMEKFCCQMSVMKGQIFNICEALKDNNSPFELVQKPSILFDCSKSLYGSTNNINNFSQNSSLFKQSAFFSCC